MAQKLEHLINKDLLANYDDELKKTYLAGGIVFDISAHKATGNPATPATFAGLEAALGTNGVNIPQNMRKGGMTVKFIKGSAQSQSNKYVQYRLKTQTFSTSVADWECIEDSVSAIEAAVGTGGSVDERIAAEGAKHYLKAETYTKTEVNGLVDTPHQEYVTVEHYADLPATGSADTIYRVSNWDGSADGGQGAVDVTMFSEYAWDGVSAPGRYVFLCVKSQIGEVFDITVYNNNTKYADLASALGTDGANVPESLRKGGMSVKYVQTYDNKYVQYFLTKNEWSASEGDWEKLNLEEEVSQLGQKIDNLSGDVSSDFKEVGSSKRAYIYGDFSAGDVVEISCVGTAVVTSGSIKVRYDDESTAIVSMSNNQTVRTTLDRDTTFIYFIVTALNITTEGTITARARFGNALLIEDKVDKVDGKGLSTNDYTNEDKAKLTALPSSEQLTEDLNSKVDKIEGKSLIDKNVADILNVNSIKKYIKVSIDQENKVLEGIKIEEGKATKHIPIDIETKDRVIGTADSKDYIEVKTDANGRIIEGVKSTGEKHISKFDQDTLDYLKEQSLGGNSTFVIPVLNATFASPVPCVVTGTKGEDTASYAFTLPLEDSYNIRFKFRITENLINQDKSCTIASVNSVSVEANVIAPSACQTEVMYQETEHTVNWPATDGGIAFNAESIDKTYGRRHIGQQAFSVKYLGTGDSDTAYIENTGSAIVLTVNSVATTYSFETYPTVSELYAAMASNANISLQFVAMDHRNCSELMVFPQVPLRATFYCNDDGGYGGPLEEHIDSAPFFLNYAVSPRWYQVEIVRIGDTIYSVCEGNIISAAASSSNDNILTLGGECNVLFKDLEICADSPSDAEYKDGYLISSVNPYIAILMVHGMMDYPAYMALTVPPAPSSDIERMNVDTMDYILSDVVRKGYLPVSVGDIAEYYTAGTPLPKRCYTLVFDDVRWQECLDLDFRKVYSRYGAKPALAMITNRDETTTHNGVTITNKEATDICHAAGWDVVTHTSTHRSTYNLKPSQYEEYLTGDLYNADAIHADGSIFVYPGGATDPYIIEVLEYLGFKCAMCVDSSPSGSNMWRNQYALRRINVSRITRDGAFVNYNNQFINKIK